LLPASICWRQKEQFSDGVGYSWIDTLKATAEQRVSDEIFKAARFRFPDNTPATKEAYWYRVMFEQHFPQASAHQTVPGGPSIACSTPIALQWSAAFKNAADPSGRSVKGVHQSAAQ
jgi:asparagine synthase (glutamine-hydrolysing)